MTCTGTRSGAAARAVVMIIRHGEKPGHSHHSGPGVERDGDRDKSSMTWTGHLRARRLVEVFAPVKGPPRPGLVRPTLLYAAGDNRHGEGKRTRQTLFPLAARLGVPVNTSFGRGDEDDLVEQVVARPGPTLICWQHGEIPVIARAFGQVSPTPPRSWPDHRFDMIWTLTGTATGWDFAQIPELVLPGDRATVFKGFKGFKG